MNNNKNIMTPLVKITSKNKIRKIAEKSSVPYFTEKKKEIQQQIKKIGYDIAKLNSGTMMSNEGTYV